MLDNPPKQYPAGVFRHEVVAAITAESARSLGLNAGRKVVVVIKSTQVMLAVED